MATTTPNLGLIKPGYDDAADVAQLNSNADAIDAWAGDTDTALAALKSDIGIVEDTDTATHNIAAGQYVIWKGSLYKASAAIATGATLSSSNLTAVTNGAADELYRSKILFATWSVTFNNSVRVDTTTTVPATAPSGVSYRAVVAFAMGNTAITNAGLVTVSCLIDPVTAGQSVWIRCQAQKASSETFGGVVFFIPVSI